jgi:hypothetical protein
MLPCDASRTRPVRHGQEALALYERLGTPEADHRASIRDLAANGLSGLMA